MLRVTFLRGGRGRAATRERSFLFWRRRPRTLVGIATPPRPRVCCVGMPRTSLCVWLVLAVESRVEMNAKSRALDTPTKTSERLREVRVMVIGKGRFLVRSPPPPPPPQGGGTWLWDRNRRWRLFLIMSKFPCSFRKFRIDIFTETWYNESVATG